VNAVSGDPELARELGTLVGKRTRSVAAAVVDAGSQSRIRSAFIAADAETRFEIGSITKGLTGMLLADAVDRGELSLDTTVDAIFPCVGTAFGSVTARELCTHTSGLPRVAGGPRMRVRALAGVLLGLDPYRGRDGPEIVLQAARESLRNRGRYQYSNLGAAVLGQCLATVAGTDYRAHLRARILLPTGMSASAVGARGDTAPRGWSSFGRRQQPWIMDGFAPAGAVVSTIADMSRLAASLLDGSAPGCRSLLAVEGVETDTPNRASGMFWIIDSIPNAERTVVWHNGQTGGHSAFLALFPEGNRAVVVLANVARAAEQQRIALGLARSKRL
jgi:CubicO group peptidase (beta-lactamase class C family)